jgi:hypothetical protein
VTQSFPDANILQTCQWIPYLVWEPEVFTVYTVDLLCSLYCHINAVYILQTRFVGLHFNITLASLTSISKRSLSFAFSSYGSSCLSVLRHARHRVGLSHTRFIFPSFWYLTKGTTYDVLNSAISCSLIFLPQYSPRPLDLKHVHPIIFASWHVIKAVSCVQFSKT